MSIDSMILGRNVDGEGVASLLNIAKITLSAAAVNSDEAVRFQEFDVAVDGLQAQVTAIAGAQTAITDVHVDTTSATLSAALALGTYDVPSHSWLFPNSDLIGKGDVMLLTNPTEAKDRAWIHVGTSNGDSSDFQRLNSDVSSIIDSAVVSAVSGLLDGVSGAGNTLKKLYALAVGLQGAVDSLGVRVDSLEGSVGTLQTSMVSKAAVGEVNITFTDANSDGILEAVVANPLSSYKLAVTVMKDKGAGNYSMVEGDAYDLTISNSTLSFRTLSPSMLNQTYKVVIVGL